MQLPPNAGGAAVALPIFLIILAVVLAFASGAQNEFVSWDDGSNWEGNVHIRSFSAENLRWMFTASLLGVWQPLSWIVAALQVRWFGANDLVALSHGVHRVNIALHAVAAVLCFFVLRRLISAAAAEQPWRTSHAVTAGATLGALFFAIHPLRVECVAWASAQPYILAVIGSMGALLCYLRAVQRTPAPGSPCYLWHAAGVLCLALALLCKAIAVPLVAVFLVLDVYPLRRLGGRAGWNAGTAARVLLEKIPYACVAAAAAGIAVWAQVTTKDYQAESALTKAVVAGYCIAFYFAMTFVPWRLAPCYAQPQPYNPADPWFAGGFLVAILITLVAILIRRRAPWFLASWLIMVLLLLPNLGLVKHGGQLAADRYTYLSGIGWDAVVGGFFAWLWASHALPRIAVALGAAAICLGLGGMTSRYCRTYHDSVSIWTAMVQRNPTWWMGPYNLAKACKDVRVNDRQAAKQWYLRAIELRPTYPEANVDLGNMLNAEGDPAGALRRYETALRDKRRNFHMAHLNIAYVLRDQGRVDDAIRHLEAAIAEASQSSDGRGRVPGMKAELARLQSQIGPSGGRKP